MLETAERVGVTKHAPERRVVAAQILKIRGIERAIDPQGHIFKSDRDVIDYVRELRGIRHFLMYLRKIAVDPVVLDVGAGTTDGIHGLATSKVAEGIRFKATGLTNQVFSHLPKVGGRRVTKADRHLGSQNLTLTSAEVLRGIADNSITGVLGVYSIGYSASPEMVVKRLDQILVPGGAVKTILRSRLERQTADTLFAYTNYHSPDPFIYEFRKLNYDVYCQPIGGTRVEVLVAIKPGGPVGIEAFDLFQADLDTVGSALSSHLRISLELQTNEIIKNNFMTDPKNININHETKVITRQNYPI